MTKITPEQRKALEGLGLELVKGDLANGGWNYVLPIKKQAMLWVKEQEKALFQLEQSRHNENIQVTQKGVQLAKRALWVAIVSLIVAVIALIK